MTGGYACIGLDSPKCHHNVGGVLRACWTYEASLLIIGNGRFKRVGTDTFKAYRHIPVLSTQDILGSIPYDCVPIAVDIVDDATPLPEFKHPERAFYIFGAEDATLGKRIIEKCKHTIFVPMRGCMNLAASVNVVLYDRLSKRGRNDP